MQTAPFILGTVTVPPYAATACDSSKAGMLQWTGSAFQGCDGQTWLTLGGTVNTASNPFSFIDQTGVAFDITVISNAITLGGFTGQLLAVCNPSCTGMYRNGVAVGMSANFSAGDTIAIQLTSASTGLTPTTASVTVGTTPSATWTVTTAPNACVGTPPPGTRCDDGTIYAGLSVDGLVPMYAAPCDAGQNWNGTSCTGTRLNMSWDDGLGNSVATGFTSPVTGRSNTAGLAAFGTSPSPAPYYAALWCHELTVSGFSDWYLPATNELITLMGNRGADSGFTIENASYWTSSEYSTGSASFRGTMSSGSQPKNYTYNSFVRCVRR